MPFAAGAPVEVRKVSASAVPHVASGAWEGWVCGSAANRLSLPANYVMRGILMRRVRVGGRIDLMRTQRNGIAAAGSFRSTPIVSISGDGLVETRNSIYRITHLGAEDPI